MPPGHKHHNHSLEKLGLRGRIARSGQHLQQASQAAKANWGLKGTAFRVGVCVCSGLTA